MRIKIDNQTLVSLLKINYQTGKLLCVNQANNTVIFTRTVDSFGLEIVLFCYVLNVIGMY